MIVKYQDLENKIILVTGATRGIGKTIASSLAEQRSHVVFNYRSNEENALQLAKDLEALGAPKATPIRFDVTNSEEMKESITHFCKEHGPISGLVNNAGISKDGLILRNKEEDIQQILDTNLKSPILLTSILSRYFLKAEDVSIVNVSSVVGLMGNPSQTNYAASKAGLFGLTKSTAKELASRKIRCNAICPGFIQTDMTDQLNEQVANNYLSNIPLGRFGDKKEVANLVSFMLGQDSSYIIREIIKIDGELYI